MYYFRFQILRHAINSLTVPMVLRNSVRFFLFAFDRIDLAMVAVWLSGCYTCVGSVTYREELHIVEEQGPRTEEIFRAIGGWLSGGNEGRERKEKRRIDSLRRGIFSLFSSFKPASPSVSCESAPSANLQEAQ